jgi:hypothetical protein
MSGRAIGRFDLQLRKERQMKYDREMWIPAGSVKVTPKCGGVVFYLYENFKGQPCAMCFIGRAVKPSWRYRYSSAAARAEAMERQVASVKAHAEMIAKRAAKRAEPHKWEVGLILYGSWGYEQTNVDFFEVVRVAGPKMVEIQKIGSVSATDDPAGFSSMSSHVVPDLESRGRKYLVKVANGSCKSPMHGSLSPWSGKPVYSSWYA